MKLLASKEHMRSALENPDTLSYIKRQVKRRGFAGDSDTLDEIASEIVVLLLENEEYYETKFEHKLGTYINLLITRAFGDFSRRRDALNGELVYLDCTRGVEEEGVSTHHDVLHPSDDLREPHRVFTKPGVPDKMSYYLSHLTDQQSDVFTMKAVYGHTHDEVADLLGISVAYSKELYKEAKRELAVFRQSEEAYEARMEIGDVSGRIMSNTSHVGGVWADWSWQESHAQPGPVYSYSEAEVAEYNREREHKLNPNWCRDCDPDNCTGCGGTLSN